MISTSSHKDWQSSLYRTYAISGNGGKEAGYVGYSYPELAPKLGFWEDWKNNVYGLSAEENNYFYLQEYYRQVLSNLDPERVYSDLDHSVLLCYESSNEFCHRHIVAAWLELLLDVEIPERKAMGSNIEDVERPEYIKIWLEEIMKMELNMRGFNSLRALYLFEKGEMCERMAEDIAQDSVVKYYDYMQAACYYRCDADEAEAIYNQSKTVRKRRHNI